MKVCRRSYALLVAAVLATLVPSLHGQAREITLDVQTPFRFVAYGDMRFTNPKKTDVSNPAARQALVAAIAEAKPAFLCVTGDLVYKGDSAKDWKTYAAETAAWEEHSIAVFPTLGNHELRGDKAKALANYFEQFPALENSRYYSVRAANVLVLVLDSNLGELSGEQGNWLRNKLEHVPAGLNFVVFVLHHPPYTASSPKVTGSGHAARMQEKNLGQWLEDAQQKTRARFVVFAGHIHNYEHYDHGGVVYFVTGGGGAHPYAVKRAAGDPLRKEKVNYHYLTVEVEASKLTVTMNRLDVRKGKQTWTQPDSIVLEAAGTTEGEQ